MRLRITILKKAACTFLLLSLFICFLSPAEPVFAFFSSTASELAELSLSLGTVDLGVVQETNDDSLIYDTQNQVLDFPSASLKNEGTLSGKLAYKVTITDKATNQPISSELTDQMTISLTVGSETETIENQAESINQNEYTFFENQSGEAYMIDPQNDEELLVNTAYSSNYLPSEDMDIIVKVTFLLIQTNAAEAKENMFHDQETLDYEMILKAAPEENKEDPSGIWPSEDEFVSGGKRAIQYSIPDTSMYFSETVNENGEVTGLANLNDVVLYVQIDKTESLDNYRIKPDSLGTKGVFDIRAEKDEKNHGFRLYISLDADLSPDVPAYSLYQYITIEKMNSEKNQYEYFDGFNYQRENLAKRLILSTDIPQMQKAYRDLPIFTVTDLQNITIMAMQGYNFNSYSIVDPHLSTVVKKVEIAAGSDVFYAEAEQDKTSIVVGQIQNISDAEGMMRVYLEGHSGKTLVISRTLISHKTAETTDGWPDPDNTSLWSDKGNGISVNEGSLKLLTVYTKDGQSAERLQAVNEPVLYVKTTGTSLTVFDFLNEQNQSGLSVKTTEYSPDGSMMKVTFAFSRNVADRNTNPDGNLPFTYSIGDNGTQFSDRWNEALYNQSSATNIPIDKILSFSADQLNSGNLQSYNLLAESQKAIPFVIDPNQENGQSLTIRSVTAKSSGYNIVQNSWNETVYSEGYPKIVSAEISGADGFTVTYSDHDLLIHYDPDSETEAFTEPKELVVTYQIAAQNGEVLELERTISVSVP